MQLPRKHVDECIFNELELILRFFTADFTPRTHAYTHIYICKQPNCWRTAASDEQWPELHAYIACWLGNSAAEHISYTFFLRKTLQAAFSGFLFCLSWSKKAF